MFYERPADQRAWSAFAHGCIALDIPFCLLIFGMWPYAINPVALVPLAPFISYLVYRRNRRRPEREWLAFHALQATLLQCIALVLVFAVPLHWFTFNVLRAVIAALVVYGLTGAVATYMGRDFTYVGLGRLAERLLRQPRQQP